MTSEDCGTSDSAQHATSRAKSHRLAEGAIARKCHPIVKLAASNLGKRRTSQVWSFAHSHLSTHQLRRLAAGDFWHYGATFVLPDKRENAPRPKYCGSACYRYGRQVGEGGVVAVCGSDVSCETGAIRPAVGSLRGGVESTLAPSFAEGCRAMLIGLR